MIITVLGEKWTVGNRHLSVLIIFAVMVFCFSSIAAANQRQTWTFTRGNGSPVTETVPFTAVEGTATVHLLSSGVSIAILKINGKVVFAPSDFSRYTGTSGRKVQLVQDQNSLEVTLMSQPGSQLIVEIVQQPIPTVPPEAVLARTAAALRAGDINVVLQGFYQNEKTLRIIPSLDAATRNQFAYEIENARPIFETKRSRAYRYSWTDESGYNFIEFAVAIDEKGDWVIVNW